MNLNYNENHCSVEIKDNYKTHYWITNISLIFAIINGILFPAVILDKKQMDGFGFIQILLAIVFLIALIYQIIMISASDNLKLSEIDFLKEKQFFERKRISLKLKNGKSRNLIDVKNEADIKTTKKFFKKLGLQTL